MTLVEIMVVVAIVSMLMGVVAVNVHRTYLEACAETTELVLERLGRDIEVHAMRHRDRLPADQAALEAAAWVEDERQLQDGWGHPIQYAAPNPDGRHDFELRSLGRDGEPGGEGFDADAAWP